MSSQIDQRNATVTLYHHLCTRAARKFMREGLDRRDLEQIAAIGLIKAADRFDATIGTPFEAYAWVLILGELMHFVRDQERMLRAPRRIYELEHRYAEAERSLYALLEREPTSREVDAMAGLTADESRALAQYRCYAAVESVEQLGSGDRRALSYSIEPELHGPVVDHMLAVLTSRERRIIDALILQDRSVTEVARELGYTTRHIARLRSAALKKMAAAARPLAM